MSRWNLETEEERFWPKVDAVGICWEWTAGLNRKGYGKFFVVRNGKRTTAQAHRFAWEFLVGLIPDGMLLDHVCRNHVCVNPDHLRLVTSQVNATENAHGVGWQVCRDKKECPRGHLYNEENTYRHGGRRHCRKCRHGRTRDRRAAGVDC